MKESLKYEKDKLKEYDKDDLEFLKSKEKAYFESGSALLEASLKVPFKSKNKVNDLIERIKEHKRNILDIGSRIEEIEREEKGTPEWISTHSILVGNGCSVSAWSSYAAGSIEARFNIETTKVKYIDKNNEIVEDEFIDDVFHSLLDNYYLQQQFGGMIPLNRVIEIDEESKVGKWYATMCQKFERQAKLNRIVKNDKDE